MTFWYCAPKNFLDHNIYVVVCQIKHKLLRLKDEKCIEGKDPKLNCSSFKNT